MQVNSSPSLSIGINNPKERHRHSMLLRSMFGFVLLYSILLLSEGSSTNFRAYAQSNVKNNNTELFFSVFVNNDDMTKSARWRNWRWYVMKRKSCFFISIGPDQFEDLLYKFRYGITKHVCYDLTSLKENPIKTNTFICEGIYCKWGAPQCCCWWGGIWICSSTFRYITLQ